MIEYSKINCGSQPVIKRTYQGSRYFSTVLTLDGSAKGTSASVGAQLHVSSVYIIDKSTYFFRLSKFMTIATWCDRNVKLYLNDMVHRKMIIMTQICHKYVFIDKFIQYIS